MENEPLNYDPEASQLASASLEQPAWLEKFKASLIRPGADGKASRMARKFFKQGDEKTYGLDNSSCPKRLTLCPCGNSRSDGYCEANHAPPAICTAICSSHDAVRSARVLPLMK